MENIQKIKKILEFLGTPYNEKNMDAIKKQEIEEIFEIADKNKIGLLFLESLKTEQLEKNTESKLEDQQKRANLQKNTWKRTVDILNNLGIKYAIIKSIFPFTAIPNDVDIIIFGNDLDYHNSIKSLEENQFFILGEATYEVNLRDKTTAKSLNPLEPDWVDVDIYREIGASKIIYLNKKNLVKHLCTIEIEGKKVKTLKPYAEMALMIFHSIYPERIYTLLLHYYILETISKMSDYDFNEFVSFVKQNSFQNAVLDTLSITEIIQEKCFGSVPSDLKKLRILFGNKKEIKIDKIPFIYPRRVLYNALWGKISETKFFTSCIKQLIAMLNPKTANFVVKVYNERSKRETY